MRTPKDRAALEALGLLVAPDGTVPPQLNGRRVPPRFEPAEIHPWRRQRDPFIDSTCTVCAVAIVIRRLATSRHLCPSHLADWFKQHKRDVAARHQAKKAAAAL